MWASKFNSSEVVSFLIKNGADVNAEMFAGMTALIWAAWKNPNPAVIETLISLGADIHHEAANGKTALDYAYLNEHLTGTNAIHYLETGNVPKRKTPSKPRARMSREQFFELCASGKPADIWTTLKRNNIDPNIKNSQGTTAIMFAAEKNSDISAVWYLYKAGADVNAKDSSGKTPLMYAASANNPDVVKILIRAGADINAKDNEGRTALITASRSNTNPDVITALLKAGADPKVRDNLGELAAGYARRSKYLEGSDAMRLLDALSR